MMKQGSGDREMVQVLWKVLFCCAIVAIILFVLGLGYLLIIDGTTTIGEQLSLQQIADAIVSVSPEGLLGLGISVVIITPLLRLLTTTSLSLRRGDRIIALITILSFLSIMISFLLKTIVF